MPISYRICTEISQTSNIPGDKSRYRTDIEKALRTEGSRDYRSKCVSGSYSHDGEYPTKAKRAEFMGYLKGKSSLMIFDRHANLKYKYGSRHFWARGYYVDTVGCNKKVIEEYIKNQLQEDIAADQITLKEYIDPFTGSKNTKA